MPAFDRNSLNPASQSSFGFLHPIFRILWRYVERLYAPNMPPELRSVPRKLYGFTHRLRTREALYGILKSLVSSAPEDSATFRTPVAIPSARFVNPCDTGDICVLRLPEEFLTK